MKKKIALPFVLPILAGCVLSFLALVGCQQPLPERDTYAGQLYQKRCGQCHQPFNPHVLTSAMWDKQLDLMDGKIRQAGMRPLSPEERQTIMDYLTHNSGQQ